MEEEIYEEMTGTEASAIDDMEQMHSDPPTGVLFSL